MQKFEYNLYMDEIKENLSKNIITLRKEKKLTQLELANKLNYSDKSVSKWENGDTVPDIEVIKRLADFFNVTVDNLIGSPEKLEKKPEEEKVIKPTRNHLVITLLSVICVWLVSTSVYVLLNIFLKTSYWLCFIWALPVSSIVLLVFNAIWGKHKFSILITSTLSWTLILSIYLQLLKYNLWVLFLIGIPLQIGIILWSRLNKYKKTNN